MTIDYCLLFEIEIKFLCAKSTERGNKMGIGLYGGPDTYVSPAKYHYKILERLYLEDEHFNRVKEIRQSETDEEALKIYYENHINTDPLLHGRYSDENEIILAIEKLKKVLEGRNIKYPTEEQAKEKRKAENRRSMEEYKANGTITDIDKMDEKTKRFIFGDM